MIIKNKDELISHGYKEERKTALEIAEYAINSVNTYESTKNIVKLEGEVLKVDDLSYNLSEIKDIYVIGGGKATYSIGRALEGILGSHLTDGVISVKKGEERRLDNIKVVEAGHPVPDENGYEATKDIMDIAKKVGENDLVFCAITGGASALLPQPAGDISLDDLKKVNKLLLDSGAPIEDINTARKHVSKTKGGRLAKMVQPAELVNFIVIDEIAGEPWGPTVGDKTTFKDAISRLEKHKLWDKTPEDIKSHLKRGAETPEMESLTPHDIRKLGVHHVIIGDNALMCEAAEEKARSLGLNAFILTSELEGESMDVGLSFAGIAKEMKKRGRPLEPPCTVIAGGETTVKVEGDGIGGPSQEFVLGAALKISEEENIVVCSIDTDGTDGPTDIAGAMVDGKTMKRAEEEGLDVFDSLHRNDTASVTTKLKDAVYTYPTETNVMNLYMIIVLE